MFMYFVQAIFKNNYYVDTTCCTLCVPIFETESRYHTSRNILIVLLWLCLTQTMSFNVSFRQKILFTKAEHMACYGTAQQLFM